MLKKTILLLSISLISKLALALDFRANRWNNMQVKINGKIAILSIYIFNENDIRGNYFYKTNEVRIPVMGKLKKSDIFLTDTDQNVINFPIKNSSNPYVYEWTSDFIGNFFDSKANTNSKTIYTLYNVSEGEYEHRYSRFEATDFEVEAFARKVKSAVINKDKEWLAENCHYPLGTYQARGLQVTTRTREQFLTDYDLIFPKDSIRVAKEWHTANLNYLFMDGLSLGISQDLSNIEIDNFPDPITNKKRLLIKGINFYFEAIKP